MADYGYGDAAPDSAKYGYNDSAPTQNKNDDPYGYGDASPDTNAYGYGDATPEDAANYGYGDDTYQTGYNDQSMGGDMQPDHRSNFRRSAGSKSDDLSVHSAATAESYGDYGEEPDPQQPRRQRYRRRGSVTKYSLDAQDTVQKEYEEHDQILNQYRGQGHQEIASSPTHMDESPDSPLQHQDDMLLQLPDAKDKKKGKKTGLRRFTMGF